MTHKVFLAAAAAIAFFVSAEAGVAFPASPISTARPAGVMKVTFWARPFPYGYAWSLARVCTRYIPVETSRGSVTQRVWVCDQRQGREVVVHYKG